LGRYVSVSESFDDFMLEVREAASAESHSQTSLVYQNDLGQLMTRHFVVFPPAIDSFAELNDPIS